MIHPVYSTMKTENTDAWKTELNQARSKPDIVDRPVTTPCTTVTIITLHNAVAE